MSQTALKAVHWNAGGQVQHVDALFQGEYDILAFTETWDFEGHKKFTDRDDYFYSHVVVLLQLSRPVVARMVG